MGGLRASGPSKVQESATPPESPWTVAISEEERVEKDTAGVIELYRASRIDDQTFIWREGMESWATLPEIPELAKALRESANAAARVPTPKITQRETRNVVPTATSRVPRPGGAATASLAPTGARPAGASLAPGGARAAGSSSLAPSAARSAGASSLAPGAARAAGGSSLAPGGRSLGGSAALSRKPQAPIAKPPPPLEEEEINRLFSDDEVTRAMGSPFEAQARLMTALTPAASDVFDDERDTRPPPDSIAPLSGRDLELIPSAPPPPRREALSDSDIKSAPALVRPSMPGRNLPRSKDETSDLFGARPNTRRPEPGPTPPAPTETKKVGERSESSVLFSLDSLTGGERRKDDARPHDSAPSLFDPMNQLPAAPLAGLAPPNLAEAMLAPPAPSLLPAPRPTPSPEELEAALAAPPVKKSGRAGMWLVLVVLAGALVVAVLRPDIPQQLTARFNEKPKTMAKLDLGAEPVANVAAPAVEAEASAAPAGAERPAVTPGAEPGKVATNEAATATGTLPKPQGPDVGIKPGSPATPGAIPGTIKPPTTDTKPTTPTTPTEPAGSDGDAPPFNVSAASASLAQAAAAAGSCKQGDTGGVGRARVTFSPSGRATTALISGDLAGTAVGGCVARLFQRARVPAFSGEPVSVTKSFSVQ